MGSTPNLGFPYPASSDAPDGPTQIEALANALDTYLHITGVAGSFTPASGFSVSSFSIREAGPCKYFHADLAYSGSAITGNASTGDIPNTLVGTLPFSPLDQHNFRFSDSTTSLFGDGYVNTSGQVYITTYVPSQSISSGDTVSVRCLLLTG